MSYNIIEQTAEMNWIKLSGKLTVQDFLELQVLGRESLVQFGRFLALIELEAFQGWSKESAGWEQTSFLMVNEGQDSKIAFVGDEKWKVDVFMFIGDSMSTTAMEFFPQDRIEQARVWLSEKS